MTKFSVIIPVYNVRNYIEQCIDSVLAQKQGNFEVILINDGSTDGSGELCDCYAKKDMRVTVIHQCNKGLSSARNNGIQKATGDYIILLDGDDYLDPEAMKHLEKIILKKEYDFIINHFILDNEGNGKKYVNSYQFDNMLLRSENPLQIYKSLLKQKFTFAGCLFVVRRDFLFQNQLFFYPGLYHEDELWVPYLFINAKKIACNNKNFYYYRTNRIGAITQKPNIRRIFSLLFILDHLLEDGKSKKYSGEKENVLCLRAADIYLALLYNLPEYQSEKEYTQLKRKLRGKQKVLLYKGTKREWLLYQIISFLGLEPVVFFIKIRKWIKKYGSSAV